MGKKWLLYLAIIATTFVAVTYAIFYYWDIDSNNKWSTFFSFTSTFGILATIFVYYMQKKLDDKKQKIKDGIVKRIILRTIEQRTNTIHSIKKFSEDINEFKKMATIISLNAVKIDQSTANLIAYGNRNESLVNPIIIYSNHEIKEAMSKRYIISDEMALITEETNQLINEIDKFISIQIIDHFSRENFPLNIKSSILSETKKGGRFDYTTKLNELHERISTLH